MGKKAIIAVALIAVIAVAAAGLYFFVLNKDNHKYAEYSVSGSVPGVATFDGTMRMTIMSETADQMEIKYDYKIYMTLEGGTRTVSEEYSETVRVDKNDLSGWDMGTRTGSATIDTKWGPKNVDIYQSTDGGETVKSYIGADGKLYKMEITSAGITLTFTLTKTNM